MSKIQVDKTLTITTFCQRNVKYIVSCLYGTDEKIEEKLEETIKETTKTIKEKSKEKRKEPTK